MAPAKIGLEMLPPLIALGFAPGIAWLLYFYVRKTETPQGPSPLLLTSFLMGLLSVIPVDFLGRYYPSDLWVATVICAPVVEEICKFLAANWFLLKRNRITEPIDGLIYGIAVALGFASVENALYMTRAYQDRILDWTFVSRALLSVPAHALISGIWAGVLGAYAMKTASRSRLLLSVLPAIACHSLFNFFARLSFWTGLAGAGVLIVVLWRLTDIKIRKARGYSPPEKTESKQSGT